MGLRRLGVASLVLSSLAITSSAHALTVSTTNDAVTLADAILGSGSAIIVTSVSYTGAAVASGTYTDGPLGIGDGAVLTSGTAQNSLPPSDSGSTGQANNLPGSPLCDALIPGYTSRDATVLTITFDLAPAFDGIQFNSVFGSEEYPEYVNSNFNDVYGVYLNGNQVAFDDNGAPITINGPFFSGGSVVLTPANGTEYDGTTGILTTSAPLVGGSTGNVLQIAICDAGDFILDSGAFISGLNGCVGEDCSGTVPCSVIDNDGDGESACSDCDDANPDTYTGADEVCDFLDNNCNGEVDEGGVCAPTCVTIQRGLGTSVVQDTWLSSASPGAGNGSYPSLFTGTSGGANKLTLARFGLEAIPMNATVTSATLSIFHKAKSVASTVNVHQANALWTEAGATYNNYGGYNAAIEASAVASGVAAWLTADVSDAVQGWVDGTPNTGFAIEEAFGGPQTEYRSSEDANASQRPKLEVCYVGGI